MEQATPGDAAAESRAENLRPGPTGRTRVGDSRAGTLEEPLGTRARNAWGHALAEPGRRRPAAGTARRVSTFRSVWQSVDLRMVPGRQPAQAEFQNDDSH